MKKKANKVVLGRVIGFITFTFGLIATVFGFIADKDDGMSFVGNMWNNYIVPSLNIHIYNDLLLGQLFAYLIVAISIAIAFTLILNLYYKKLSADFTQTICRDTEYYQWSIRILEHLYSNKYLIKNIYDNNGCIPYYPCSIIKTKECNVDNFKLCKINFDKYMTSNKISDHINIDILATNKGVKNLFSTQKQIILRYLYKKIISSSITQINFGFLLDKMNINDSGICESISCNLGAYNQNVYTSHILEFELYMAYKKFKRQNNLSEVPERILDLLPYRNQIHRDNNNNIEDIVHSGKGRFSLLSVQLMIIYFDKGKGEYCTLLKKRSEKKLASKAGYLQFVPAGGFELFEKKELCRNIKNVEDSYSLKYAIYRELLEELFNKELYKEHYSDSDVTEINNIIDRDPIMKVIREYSKNDINKIHLLGIATDVLPLRSMFCCALRIDDPKFKDDFMININYNDEFDANGGSAVVKLRDLESVFRNNIKITPDSIAMYALAKESKLYQEIVDNDYKLIKPEN